MQKGVKNAIMNSHNGYISFATNHPYNGDSEKQYYADLTKAYYQENLQYASNVVMAQVQGVNYDDFYAFTPLRIRTAMVIDPTTGNNLGSDWQRVIVEDGSIDFLPRGAKVIFNGNTWLVSNPMNVESVLGTSVICRCNATWHYLDEYGNVQSEPFRYGQGAGELATTNDVKENMILMNGYQHSVMQYNPQTAVLHHNMRMILGNQAFTVRGLQNFVQEFTQDEDSVHIQYFELAKAEPLEIDDMENRVADGKAFRWEIAIVGQEQMNLSEQQMLTAISMKNGEETALETSYLWESSNDAVLSVNENGVVTSVGVGDAVVTCTLKQNPNLTQKMTITVQEGGELPSLVWDTPVPEALKQYQSATIRADVLGAEYVPVSYSLTGANPDCYKAEQENNNLTISCWYPSDKPLTVEATANGETLRAEIALEGW